MREYTFIFLASHPQPFIKSAFTTYSRHLFFRQFVCEKLEGLPSIPDPSLLQIDGGFDAAFSRLDCSSSPSGLSSINLASMITTCLLSTLSTGWFSRLGDMHGRRYALMIPVLGSILLCAFPIRVVIVILNHVMQKPHLYFNRRQPSVRRPGATLHICWATVRGLARRFRHISWSRSRVRFAQAVNTGSHLSLPSYAADVSPAGSWSVI